MKFCVDMSCWPVFQMITKNFEDYPEHRLKFFSLLRAIAAHCFPALIRLSSEVCVYICSRYCLVLIHSLWSIWIYELVEISSFWMWLCISSTSMFLFFIYSNLPLILYSCLRSTSATEACDGFYHMGFPTHWKKHCWNWTKPSLGDAEELSGVLCHMILCPCVLLIYEPLECSYWKGYYLAGFWVL